MEIKSISTDLELAADGIWYGPGGQIISYPSDGNEICFDVEGNSFWFKHRNNCIASIVRLYPPGGDGTIFDIGGGNGFVSEALAKAGFNPILVEPGPDGARNAKSRGIGTVICATLDKANFESRSLPAVGLFDVVEHIEDDLSFLESIRTLMRPNGRLYVTVPAYSFLWSSDDIISGHFRRYTVKEITKTIEAAGFEIEFASYIFRFIPIPAFFLRVLPYRIGIRKTEREVKSKRRQHLASGGFIASLVHRILQPEVDNLDKNTAMRFGGSCLIAARSPA